MSTTAAALPDRLEERRGADRRTVAERRLAHYQDQAELSSKDVLISELAAALRMQDQAENGPWDGVEQKRYLAQAKAARIKALARVPT